MLLETACFSLSPYLLTRSCFPLCSSHCSINMPRTLCLKHLTVAVPSVWNAFPSEICMACPSFLREGSLATLRKIALTAAHSLAPLPCFTFLCSSWSHCTCIFTYLFCCLSPPSWRKASRGQGLIIFTVSLMHRVPPGMWWMTSTVLPNEQDIQSRLMMVQLNFSTFSWRESYKLSVETVLWILTFSQAEPHLPVSHIVSKVNNHTATTTLYPYNHSVFHFQYNIQ